MSEVPCIECPRNTYYGCTQGFTCGRFIVWKAVEKRKLVGAVDWSPTEGKDRYLKLPGVVNQVERK
ncbi:MAG: hypothetical protein ACTSV2_03595 [Candidatus Thorarchaeota archaeon]